jgi:hypothetical protein
LKKCKISIGKNVKSLTVEKIDWRKSEVFAKQKERERVDYIQTRAERNCNI